MLRDAALVAERDLRIELRSRVATNQVAPFALVVLVLFGFALDADQNLLSEITPGLYWLTVLFSALLAVSRSGSLDDSPGLRDALRLSALDPAGVFLGKVGAVAVQLLLLEVLLALGVSLFFEASFSGYLLVAATCLAVTAAVSASGVLYAGLVAGLRVGHTLLPLLLLPALAPVLLAASQAFASAFGQTLTNGWAWCGLAAGIAVIYLLVGSMAYGALLEAV